MRRISMSETVKTLLYFRMVGLGAVAAAHVVVLVPMLALVKIAAIFIGPPASVYLFWPMMPFGEMIFQRIMAWMESE